jgi:hypothetical protein
MGRWNTADLAGSVLMTNPLCLEQGYRSKLPIPMYER